MAVSRVILLGLMVLVTLTWAQDFPENEYVYSVRRDWLVAAERDLQRARPRLSADEVIVDNYLNYLKWEEFERTRNATADNFPPSRPIEEVQKNIEASEVYRVLQKLPKGGNMHSHEYHQLSKRLFLQLIWDSPQFENLYILPEDHPTDPWKLDFFLNPPSAEWLKVKDNQDKYSLEQVYPNQILLGVLNDFAKSRPTDSTERWRQLDPLWLRGSFQVAGYIPIKKMYLEEMYKQGLQEGVQYIETRRAFGPFEHLYELDPDPQYANDGGKKYFPPETEIELTLEVIANVTKEYPEFIGHRRIGFVQRQQPKQTVKNELDIIIDLHRKYPDHVIGADLVGQEDAGNSHLYYIDQMLELLDPATGKSKIPLFLHSSETNWMEEVRSSRMEEDPVSTLQNAYETILLQSKRIGHGFGFSKHPGLLQVIRERDIAIEICPVSNQVLGYAPDMRNHPAIHFLRSGVSIVLGSDDPGTFGVDPFTIDWYEAFMAWGLGLADLKQFALASLEYSGLSDAETSAAMTNKWQPKWEEYISNMKTEACNYNFNSGDPPSVVRIFPRSGAVTGSTRVHVYGRNFQRGICNMVLCKFGARDSAPATYVSHDHVICVTPDRGSNTEEETVEVQLSLDGGTTFIPTNDNFVYIFPEYAVTVTNPTSAGFTINPSLFTMIISTVFMLKMLLM